jgi:sugar lactone lactonase YvrE
MTLKTKVLGIVQSTVALAAAALLPLGAACSTDGEGGELEESAAPPHVGEPELLISGLDGAQGSTVGPDGKLYVTEGRAGRIQRVDPNTGATTLFASGLPQQIPAVGIGGPVDVAFLGNTAYALVTLVGSDVGGSSVAGIYRIDSPTSSTLIADVGAFSVANPPSTDFFIPTGVQYALEVDGNALLVSDGHHNRILRVTSAGAISVLKSFGNVVPTGLETHGNRVYMAQAGPVPHLPATGTVVSFKGSGSVSQEASGGPLLVDVEINRGKTYGLSQGFFPPSNPEGSPAAPNTGALLQAEHNGTFSVLVDELNQPTSVELIGDMAYVVTLPGDVWKIDLRAH